MLGMAFGRVYSIILWNMSSCSVVASVVFSTCDMLQLRKQFLGLGDGPVDKGVGYGDLKTRAK